MSVSPHDAVLPSGLIVPENIPGPDLDPAVLEAVASTLRTAGGTAVDHSVAAQASWAGLQASLESPQAPVIYAALATPSSAVRSIESKFSRVADALDAFAQALGPITREFDAIRADAVDFRATITWDERVWVSPLETKEYYGNGLATVSSSTYHASYTTNRTQEEVVAYLRGRGEYVRVRGGAVQILAHWTESSEHVDENNRLMDRLADAYTRLQNAEADCANAINGQRELCLAEVEHIEAWQLTQSGELTVTLPWGSRVDEDRNCGESFWWGAGNAGKEVLEGAGGLFGYNAMRGDWTLDQAGQSWAGAIQGIGALLVVTSPPLMILGMAGVPVLKDGVAMGGEMVKGLVAWDTWAENPAEAAGRVVVNVGSMFVPGAGQVAAAVKALSLGSRIAHLAGDAARLADAALTGLGKVGSLATRLDGLAGDALGTGVRLDELVTAAVRSDLPDSDLLHVGVRSGDGPGAPGSFFGDGPSGPARAPHGPEADTPAARGDGPDAPRGDGPDAHGDGPGTHGDGPDGSRGDAPDAEGPAPHGDGPDSPRGDGADTPGDVDPRSLDRTDPERGNNPDGTWDGKSGLHLESADNAVVQRYAAESVGIEARVRPTLEGIVDSVGPGARLVGLDESVKFADSLKGKVAGRMLENPELTAVNALAEIKDSVRYTVESPVAQYASTVARTVEQLKAAGFQLVKLADSWESPGYKGVNSSWIDPSTGRVIEVQFHTPESFVVKSATHDAYDALRTPDLPAAEIARLEKLIDDAFDPVEIPPGAGLLGELFELDGIPAAGGPPPASAGAGGPGTALAVREFLGDDEIFRIVNDDYGAAVFGANLLEHYVKAQPTLGRPGSPGSFFLMPAEDVLRVTDAASAARQTGMSPSTLGTYTRQWEAVSPPLPGASDIFAILFPREGMPLARPTPVDAGLGSPSGVWPHFLDEPDPTGPWGHTAVRGDGFYLRNPTRELVTPNGWQLGPGSVLVRRDADGWQVLRRIP